MQHLSLHFDFDFILVLMIKNYFFKIIENQLIKVT
jgi:hypothetical protein